MPSGEITVQLSGSLDIETVPQWSTHILAAATAAAVVTVDAHQLEFIDSTGAGILMRLTRELGEQGCLVVVRALQPEILEVLEVMGIVPLLNIAR